MSCRRYGRRQGRRRSLESIIGQIGGLVAGLALVAWTMIPRGVLVMVGFLAGFAFLAVIGFVLWDWRRKHRAELAAAEAQELEKAVAATRILPLDSESIAAALNGQEPPPALPRSKTPVRPSPARTPHPSVELAPSSERSLAERVEAIDWFQFERLMARAYEKLGYTVERRGGAHADDGIDLVIRKDAEAVGVQCKHWKAWKVNPKTVREMLGAITAAKLGSGMILCWRGFTQEGHARAAEYGITLVDAAGILRILESVDARFDPELQALLDDQRKFCPRCEAPMEPRIATRGSNAGGKFWGCTRYPRCDFTFEENGRARDRELQHD